MRVLGGLGAERKAGLVIPLPLAGSGVASEVTSVRRRLSPAAGRALEILSHAIEYLADEYAASGDKGPLGRADPRVEAIQILKRLNREVYYSGSQVASGASRIRRWFEAL